MLAPGELLVGFRIARPPARASDAYLRFIPRTEMDIAVVGAGVAVALDASGRCTARGSRSARSRRRRSWCADAASALVGSRGEDAALARAGEAASAAARPISDKRGTVEYRRKVAGVLVRRAALAAFERARGGASA